MDIPPSPAVPSPPCRWTPRRVRRAAAIGCALLVVGGLVAAAFLSGRERCPSTGTPWYGGVWFRANDPGGTVWDDHTREESGFVLLRRAPVPSAVGDTARYWSKPRSRFEWLRHPFTRRTWRPAGGQVTVVESVSEDGVVWLHGLQVIENLPEADWCPSRVSGEWALTLPGIDAPVQVRFAPDGVVTLGPDYVRGTGNWRARDPDVFLDLHESTISTASGSAPPPDRLPRTVHARLSPDGRSFVSESTPGVSGRRR